MSSFEDQMVWNSILYSALHYSTTQLQNSSPLIHSYLPFKSRIRSPTGRPRPKGQRFTQRLWVQAQGAVHRAEISTRRKYRASREEGSACRSKWDIEGKAHQDQGQAHGLRVTTGNDERQHLAGSIQGRVRTSQGKSSTSGAWKGRMERALLHCWGGKWCVYAEDPNAWSTDPRVTSEATRSQVINARCVRRRTKM